MALQIIPPIQPNGARVVNVKERGYGSALSRELNPLMENILLWAMQIQHIILKI